MSRRLMVSINRVVNVVVRALRLRRFRGGDLLYLTTVGRTSGKPRTTPLIYLADGDRWIVVASNGGNDWEPGWWLNLRAGADATIDVRGTKTRVRGAELDGEAREAMWQHLNADLYDFDSYQRKVSRRIAVVALTPTS